MKAWRQWSQTQRFYVANLPEGKADWGYTTNPANAIELTPYWGKRFASDCRHVGSEARFF